MNQGINAIQLRKAVQVGRNIAKHQSLLAFIARRAARPASVATPAESTLVSLGQVDLGLARRRSPANPLAELRRRWPSSAIDVGWLKHQDFALGSRRRLLFLSVSVLIRPSMPPLLISLAKVPL